MKQWRPKSLFMRLFLSILLTISVTMTAVILIQPRHLTASLVDIAEKDMLAKMERFLPEVARYLSGSPPYFTIVPLVNTLENLLGAKIYIANRNGYIDVVGASFGNRADLPERYINQNDLANLQAGQRISRRDTIIVENEREGIQALTIMLPVFVSVNNQSVMYMGSVFLQTPLTSLSASAAVVKEQISYVPFLATLVASLMAGIISHSISKPLKQLSAAANIMSNGDYSVRVKVEAEDEIGWLGTGFNVMADSLEESIKSLEDSRHRIERLILALTEGVIASDANHSIILFNPAAEQFFNLEAPKIIGLPFEATALPESIKKLLASNSPIPQSEVISLSDQLTLAVTTSPILDDSSNFSAQVAVLKDITEAHRLEQLRKDFVANVSHELRTPLTSIQGFVEAMLDQTIPQEQNGRYLQIIHKESMRLTRMIHELLDLSHIESGHLVLQLEPINFPSLLHNVVLQAKMSHGVTDANFTIKIDNEHTMLHADADRLEQILLNLITNAIKFSNPPPHIQINSQVVPEHPEKLLISVLDNGNGINAEDLPYIWDRFFKADKSRSSKGTGLGLSIVRSLVEAHHETIWVENSLQQGACFTFTIPLNNE